MTKKEFSLVVITIVLAGLYIYYFTDLFAPKTIQIQHTVRPYREAWGPGGRATNATDRLTYVISFVMTREWPLNEVLVVPAAEYQTNKYAHPIWHMVTETKTRPTKAFVYGGEIPGMHPSVQGAEPDPVQPGIAYKLIVRSGKRQGEHDFEIVRTTAR